MIIIERPIVLSLMIFQMLNGSLKGQYLYPFSAKLTDEDVEDVIGALRRILRFNRGKI